MQSFVMMVLCRCSATE